MSQCPIYTLTYHPDKVLTDYERGIQKAILSQTKIIELDFLITRTEFFSSILDNIFATPLQVAFRCAAGDVQYLPANAGKKIYEVHVYFSHSNEIKKNLELLKELSSSVKYILNGNKDSDFVETAKLFLASVKKPLHFYFAPFSANNSKSLRTREVAGIIANLQKQFPHLAISPLPGLELTDQKIDSALDLEPLMEDPNRELKVSGNEIEFTFIIPTHNSKHFLVNVLAHIFKQNIPLNKFEVIVVDDGSTDGSLDFVDSYLKSEQVEGNFRYFYWPKPAPKPYEKPVFRAGLCRNLGANRSRGKYLIFLDSDILIPKNFLEDLGNCFKSKDVIQYVRHHIRPEKSNSYVSFNTVSPKDIYVEEANYWGPYFEHPHWPDMPFFWKYTCTYCLAVCKEDFFAVGRFRRAFVSYGFEDTDLGYRLFKKGLRFHLSKTVTLHLTPPASAMNSGGSQFKRFIALSKTAKIFFLSNLDITIYEHFQNYMGGERQLIKESIYFLGRFLSKFSKEPKKSDPLVR